MEEGGGMGGGGMGASIFEHFFGGGGMGGGGGRGGPRGPRKTEDVVHGLAVTLEDLYKGKLTKMKISRKVVCKTCTGSGGKDGKAPKTCDGCRGRGIRLVVHQLGPGMIQQMQTTCDECSGTGEKMADADKCGDCKGRKVVTDKEVIEVHIAPGMQHNQKITLYGKADEAPGFEAGDIVFVLQQKEHERFERKGDDLYLKQKVSLAEALCGFKFVINHLDGRQLLVCSCEGEVLSPGLVKGVANEGMPVHKQSYKGTLFLTFEIEFPPSIPVDLQEKLSELLPPAARPKYDDSAVEEVVLSVDHNDRRRGAGARQGDAYDSDEEYGAGGGPGGQRVQCAQS
jgi:DnaJ family protein A protein 2